MSYSDIKITQADINNNNVRSASDILIGNADDNKAVFDKLPEFIAGKHNDLVDALDEVSEHAQGDTEEIDRLSAEKVNVPKNGTDPDFGEAGQMLTTKGNGETQWEDAGQPTDEQTQNAINNWLDAHPEATTTVEDGSLTYNKLVKGTLGFVTPEMYGATGDGVTDDTNSFINALASDFDLVIPKGIYKINGYVFANANKNVIVSSEAVFPNKHIAYAKKRSISSVSQFGQIGAIESPSANITQYSESFCYDKNSDRYIIGYYASNETEKTMLAVVDPSTYTIENTHTYALDDLQTLTYNPNQDVIYMCSESYDGIYSIDANLASNPSKITGLDDAKILLYDSALDVLVSLKYDGNTLRVNVFDADYTQIIHTISVDVSAYNLEGINGAEVYDGKIYQASWFNILEIDIVSGEVNCLGTTPDSEIEDFCEVSGKMQMLTHELYQASNYAKPALIYEYNPDVIPSVRKQYRQLPNDSFTNVDLNLITSQGVSSVYTANVGTNNFPVGCSQGYLVNILQTNQNYGQQFAHQYYVDSITGRMYKRSLYVFDGNWSNWEYIPIIKSIRKTLSLDSTFGFASTGISSSSQVLLAAQAIDKSNTTIDITVDTSNSVYRIQARATTTGNYFKGENISVLLVYMDI